LRHVTQPGLIFTENMSKMQNSVDRLTNDRQWKLWCRAFNKYCSTLNISNIKASENYEKPKIKVNMMATKQLTW